jgi:hypothetical protein
VIGAGQEVGLQGNAAENKYMLMSHHQNAGENRNIRAAGRSFESFENVAKFKYLGTTVTNQNLIQEEIDRSLNSGNVCFH